LQAKEARLCGSFSLGGESASARVDGSVSCVVEVLQELVGSKLDLFVAPLCGPVVAGDQAHAMDAPKVPIHERVPALVSSAAPSVSPRCQAEYSSGVGLQEGVLLGGARLHVVPRTPKHVLVRVDQPSRSCVDGNRCLTL
jgi:hypothetical protein